MDIAPPLNWRIGGGGESKFDFPIFLLVLGVWGEGSEIRGNSRLEGVCMGLGSKVWERTQRMEKNTERLASPLRIFLQYSTRNWKKAGHDFEDVYARARDAQRDPSESSLCAMC